MSSVRAQQHNTISVAFKKNMNSSEVGATLHFHFHTDPQAEGALKYEICYFFLLSAQRLV